MKLFFAFLHILPFWPNILGTYFYVNTYKYISSSSKAVWYPIYGFILIDLTNFLFMNI